MLVFNNSFLSLIYSETLEKTYDASSKDSIAYVTIDSVTPVIPIPLYLRAGYWPDSEPRGMPNAACRMLCWGLSRGTRYF